MIIRKYFLFLVGIFFLVPFWLGAPNSEKKAKSAKKKPGKSKNKNKRAKTGGKSAQPRSAVGTHSPVASVSTVKPIVARPQEVTKSKISREAIKINEEELGRLKYRRDRLSDLGLSIKGTINRVQEEIKNSTAVKK